MKLTKRLETILSFVPEKGNIFDIGCDHGIVAVSLALKGRNVTAIDIHEKALNKAITLAKENHVYDQMNFYVHDGIDGIPHKDEDTFIITGMGGYTILHILQSEKDGTYILEAHTDLPFLRREMVKKGFYIKEEKALYDKKWYVIMKWEKGKKVYSETDYLFGPFCKENKTYMNDMKKKYETIYKKSNNEEVKKILELIEKTLK